MKNYHGIIEQLHFINQRQAELQNDLHVEQKKKHQPYCSNSGSDDKWWSNSMECYCYLRDDQDLLADGKTQIEGRFGECFKDMLCSQGKFGRNTF